MGSSRISAGVSGTFKDSGFSHGIESTFCKAAMARSDVERQRSGGAGEQSEEMAAGAGEHEQMPDEMGVTHVFVDEK
jgi:hypothetical protein